MKTKRNNRSGRKLSQRRMLTKLKKRSSMGRRSRRVIGGRPFGEAEFDIGLKRSRYDDDDVEMPVAKKFMEESYTFYVFDNSDESRQIVGIDTPEMQHVSVNDYINSIENAYQDLRKNRLKSPEEKQKEEEFKKRMFAEVFPLLPQTGLVKAEDNLEIINLTEKDESTFTTNNRIINIVDRLERIRSKLLKLQPKSFNKSIKSATYNGGAPRFSGNLQDTLTMAKLRKYLDLVGHIEDTERRWVDRVIFFLKFMFNTMSEENLYISDDSKLQRKILKLRGEKIDDYNFDLIKMSFRKMEPNSTRVLFSSMPDAVLYSGMQDTTRHKFSLKSVPPFCVSYNHDDLISETKNTNNFPAVGKFDAMSPPELRHLIYSVIAFIIFSNNGDTFENLCDEFELAEGVDLPWESIFQPTIPLKKLLELVKPKSIKPELSFENKLPHFVFYTTVDTDYDKNKITQSDIRMINPNPFRTRDPRLTDQNPMAETDQIISKYINPFKEILDNLYKKIFANAPEEPKQGFSFGFDTPPFPGDTPNKVHLVSIPLGSSYGLRFEFGIKSPSNYDPSGSKSDGKDGIGLIFDKNGKSHSFIPNSQTVDYFPSSSRTTQVPIEMICETIRYLFNVDSRIPILRDKILGYLSDIVYYPNDVVKKLSTDYMSGMSGVPQVGSSAIRKLYYIGGFDDDPSYPYAFSTLSPAESPKPSYSRVHVWLNYPSSGVKGIKKDVEIYYVSRGSKTGYDWDLADMDIANGILFSERNSNALNVLRKVIKKINDLITSHELPGMGGRNVQIYSSGHSLGGNLSLSISYLTLNQHSIKGLSFEKLSGSSGSNSKGFIRPYIIPIVFDPYVASLPLISAYSTLPYTHIHSCVDSDFQRILPRARSDMSDDITKPAFLTQKFVYDDPASGFFINYLRLKHGHAIYNSSMGKFRIFLYKNPHNFFTDTEIHYPGMSRKDRIFADMARSHDLREMIGIKANYVWVNETTNLFIKNGVRNQSMQISAYIYPTPNGLYFEKINSAVGKGETTIDTYKVEDANNEMTIADFDPIEKDTLLEECKRSLIDDFRQFLAPSS